MFSSSSANIPLSNSRDRATGVFQIVQLSSSPQSARFQVEEYIRDEIADIMRMRIADRGRDDDAGRHMSRLRRAALALASRGLQVFPCIPKGKTPATAHGLLDASVDPAVIERWWAANPEYNVAIATGAPSGIFIVDVDGADAEAKLRALEAINGALPASVEVITGQGRHTYFRMPPDVEIRNSASKVAPDVDIRATGGYALVPPSVHPSGRRYCWSVDSAHAIAEPPAWLLSLIASSAAPCATPPSVWHELVAEGVSTGSRNDAVARLIGHLLRRFVDPQVSLELVRTWNAVRCRPPLPDDEVTSIVNSIAGKELKRRQEAGRG